MNLKQLVRTFAVNREDTQCNALVLVKYRDENGSDGVQFVAWHQVDDTTYIQTDFVPMEERFIDAYMRDMSMHTASEYVHSFTP